MTISEYLIRYFERSKWFRFYYCSHTKKIVRVQNVIFIKSNDFSRINTPWNVVFERWRILVLPIEMVIVGIPNDFVQNNTIELQPTMLDAPLDKHVAQNCMVEDMTHSNQNLIEPKFMWRSKHSNVNSYSVPTYKNILLY